MPIKKLLKCSNDLEYFLIKIINPNINVIVDTGYQGIQKLYSKSELPKKKSKKNPLTKEYNQKNQELVNQRVVNENVTVCSKDLKSYLRNIEKDAKICSQIQFNSSYL